MQIRSGSMNDGCLESSRQVLISGYSGRAAAWSAVRAGLEPIVLDECQDLDLPPGSCPASGSTLADFPAEIPFLPTGGWENRLAELKRIAASRPLWSPSPAAMQQARNPMQLQQLLEQAGFNSLGIRTCEESWQPHGKTSVRQWIRKGKSSTGGMAVRRLISGDISSLDADEFDQQYVEGDLFSAQFFSTEDEHELLGITRLIAGCPELPDRPFAYVGNVSCSPAESAAVEPMVQQIGKLLGNAFSLRGPWGIDLCLADRQLFVLELNPRYTAAMEVIELATGLSVLEQFTRSQSSPVARTGASVGKATIYAPKEFSLSPDWNWTNAGARSYGCWDVPTISDLARPGTRFAAGDPVCTVWGEGISMARCLGKMEESRAGLLEKLLSETNFTSNLR